MINLNPILRFALGFANIPEDRIADLDKALPGLSRIAELAKEAEPILTAAKPHLDALEPLVIQLWPILQKAWPDIVSVTPTVEEYIDLAQNRGNL